MSDQPPPHQPLLVPDDPVDPGTAVPTPPTQPPDISQLAPETHPIVEHVWQPPPVIPTPVMPELPTGAPVVVDAPYLSQDANLLNCTMGNWQNEPSGYRYQWQRDGTDVNVAGPIFLVMAPDAGMTFTCGVTASNLVGSATATSNAVVATFTPPTIR